LDWKTFQTSPGELTAVSQTSQMKFKGFTFKESEKRERGKKKGKRKGNENEKEKSKKEKGHYSLHV